MHMFFHLTTIIITTQSGRLSTQRQRGDKSRNLWAVDLKGFERPRCVQSSTLDISIRYIFTQITGAQTAALALALGDLQTWLVSAQSQGERVK